MLLDEFIIKQKHLLELERAEEVNRSKSLMECSQKILEERNLCIRKLSIANVFTGLYGRTILEFELKSKKEELTRRVFSQGDIVGIYSASKVITSEALASGLFYKSNRENIQIALDNNLESIDEIMQNEALFCLVKLSSEITYSRLKSGLKYLEKRSNPFCGDYLIDLLLGNSKLAESNYEKEITFYNENLNHSQMDAVRFALSRPHIAIIHGPPGTGKSTVAVEIINQILNSSNNNKNPKILVCTPSNIALDNLAEKLLRSQTSKPTNNRNSKSNKSKMNKCNLLRLGHSARVMPHLSDISIDSRLSTCDQAELIFQVRSQIDSILNKSVKYHNQRRELSDLRKELREREMKAVREVLNWSNVVMSTLTGLKSNKSLPLNEIEFDVVLIDESSQAIESACWLAIPRGRKLILAGDHQQLPPTVLSEEAMRQGLGVSLMERLLDLYPGNEITRLLSCQYRMHENIMRWSSNTFYNSLLNADITVAQHTLKDIFTESPLENQDYFGPLTFLDTAGCDLYELESAQEDSKANLGEAQLVAVYIEKLVGRFNLQPQHVGVITPYSRQVQLIKEAIRNRKEFENLKFDQNLIEVSTVDGFQGREKEVIIITLVRSNLSGTVGFLAEHRRLNVALTRAKRHLCVIGDSSTMEHSNDQVLQSLVNYWNENADVQSAYDYVYEYDISAGDCIKPKFSKPVKPNGIRNKTSKVIRSNEDELEKKVCDQLRKFKLDDAQKIIEFPSELSSRIRAVLHELAESLGLEHQSVGEDSKRKLVVKKTVMTNKMQLQVLKNLDDVNVLIDNCKPVTEKSIVSGSPILISGQQNFVNTKENVEDSYKGSIKVHCKDIKSEKSTLPLIDNFQINQKELKSSNKDGKNSKSKESNSSQKITEASSQLKKSKCKNSVQQTKSEIPEDFDQMLEYFQKLDKICQFSGKQCSTLVSTLGINCQFCKKRFCLSHAQPEVHLCPLATTSAWRELDSRPKQSSNSQKLRHAQLSHLLHRKMKSNKCDKN